VVVEIKACEAIQPIHEAQLLTYETGQERGRLAERVFPEGEIGIFS